MQKIEMYRVTNYAVANSKFIENKDNRELYNAQKAKKILQSDNGYHFRVHKNMTYIFFGDLDHYSDGIINFRDILNQHLNKCYGLSFDDNDFKYTQNDVKRDSFHYSIPKWNMKIEYLKDILDELKKNNASWRDSIDTSIYSEHWYRCPNQTKGIGVGQGVHIIKCGAIEDFLISYIPDGSINIDDVVQKSNKKKEQPDNDNLKSEHANNVIELHRNEQCNNVVVPYKKDDMLSTTMATPDLYKKMFDECYKEFRFDTYDYWLSIGMAIKNTFDDEEEAFDLFNYYSAKGTKYEGSEITRGKYMTFTKKKKAGYTIATIYYYAIEDNKPKFIEIMNKNTFELGQTDMCKYLKIIAGHKFLYKVNGDNGYKLYCYNGKYWQNDDIIMKKCMSTELYNFLKMVLIEVYWNAPNFNVSKSKIDKLKTVTFKRDLVETYKEIGVNNNIKFDDNWRLFGFANGVYDMEDEIFRDYRYDDYISITTGYDWREPTENELQTMHELIAQIMPVENERDLYLQILCTAIEGRCLEKFIIFCGSGGNGKGMINDMLVLALGHHALMGNNAILFECSKTGSNPEKANMHKKRLTIFREPPEKHKFENSIIKELSGGGTFSARTHHEKETEKELNSTIIIECNKKPLFAEDPTDADVRRIIDLHFRSTFTEDIRLLDDTKHIYKANLLYKTKEFQEKHKYALLKILMKEHIKYYKQRNSVLRIPEVVEERTKFYLELSCNIVQWFKENYKCVNDDTLCKLKDVYGDFVESEYYCNLTKADKRKYNKRFFVEYFETNVFLKKYFVVSRCASCIKGWIKCVNDD